MDKNLQYYANRNKYNNICIPKREGILNYLIKEKFLSEFQTNEEKNRVLDNLGISQKLQDLLQLINQRATLQELSRYVTMAELLRKLASIKPQDEKSKGYFSSYEQLIQDYPSGEKGDWAIVNVEGVWYIYRYKERVGWEQSETYDNSIDLSEYAKLSDLNNLQGSLESDIQNLQEDLEQNIQNLQEQIQNSGGGNNTEIPPNIGLELSQLQEGLQSEINRAQGQESDIKDRLTALENDPSFAYNGIKHKLISKKGYDLLESYDKNTLYLIVDFTENTSVFGDTFPLILGGDYESSSSFGDTFPLVFGTGNYYIGSKFPIKFKQ